MAAAAVSGFIAKENVVATIAVCYVLTDITAELPGAAPELTAVAGLAYLMFNLFSPPCFAAIGAMNSEMKSSKWLLGGVALQLAVGYTIGYLVYQIGTIITTGFAGAGFIPGLISIIVIASIVAYLCLSSEKQTKAEYSLDG